MVDHRQVLHHSDLNKEGLLANKGHIFKLIKYDNYCNDKTCYFEQEKRYKNSSLVSNVHVNQSTKSLMETSTEQKSDLLEDNPVHMHQLLVEWLVVLYSVGMSDSGHNYILDCMQLELGQAGKNTRDL